MDAGTAEIAKLVTVPSKVDGMDGMDGMFIWALAVKPKNFSVANRQRRNSADISLVSVINIQRYRESKMFLPQRPKPTETSHPSHPSHPTFS
jgi:hypothetical protein